METDSCRIFMSKRQKCEFSTIPYLSKSLETISSNQSCKARQALSFCKIMQEIIFLFDRRSYATDCLFFSTFFW